MAKKGYTTYITPGPIAGLNYHVMYMSAASLRTIYNKQFGKRAFTISKAGVIKVLKKRYRLTDSLMLVRTALRVQHWDLINALIRIGVLGIDELRINSRLTRQED